MKALLLALILALNINAHSQTEIRISTYNVVNMRGSVTAYSVAQWQSELFRQVVRRGNAKYPIYLVIDSGGGSIEAGLTLLEYARTIPNLHTITIYGASMASAIAMQIPGKRFVTDSGIFMFHRAYAGVEGQVEVGELEARLAMIKSRVLRLERANSSRIGISLEVYKGKVVNEWWLDSDEAISQKVADEKVTISCTSDLIKATFISQVQDFFGVVETKESGCPLFRFGIK